MSAFLSSIKTMVDNYGQGIISIQGKLRANKFIINTNQKHTTYIQLPSNMNIQP